MLFAYGILGRAIPHDLFEREDLLTHVGMCNHLTAHLMMASFGPLKNVELGQGDHGSHCGSLPVTHPHIHPSVSDVPRCTI